ncbi:DUF6950 family protein [Asticcacaulis sp.]|uniref:DUF6950 family protein n=1 Tax=Asticcacaulis sp. TaxID=1872648 RepID=UPI003F7CD077
MEMVHRIACASETVAQYIDARFQWGRKDCARMCAAHVRRMGHTVSLVKAGDYSSLKGAKAALKRAGFDTLEAALDARFDRIAPAAALPGDIIALPSDHELPALAVRLSNNAVLHTSNGGFAVSEPLAFVAAWRVPCLIGSPHV